MSSFYFIVVPVKYFRGSGADNLWGAARDACWREGMDLIAFETREEVDGVRRWWPELVRKYTIDNWSNSGGGNSRCGGQIVTH